MSRLRYCEWNVTVRSTFIPPEILERIVRRRRQMLVHSCIYYQMDDSVVDDHLWQRWADELVELQFWWGENLGFYDHLFKNWDASTGYHLVPDPDVIRVAERTLADSTARRAGQKD